MGQYYRPCILKKDYKTSKSNPVDVTLVSWDFMDGAKLMEHSYVGNWFVSAMCDLLSQEKYFGRPFVWCGDYADEVEVNGVSTDIYEMASEKRDKQIGDLAKEYNKKFEENGVPTFGYVVNLTKKEYCTIPKHRDNELTIHPLPILCSSGNGRGGGDFDSVIENDERIGSWAFDEIGITNDIEKYKDFKKIDGAFKEDR